jgi:2-iminobutanoate/2-iminopropanoate deaminase
MILYYVIKAKSSSKTVHQLTDRACTGLLAVCDAAYFSTTITITNEEIELMKRVTVTEDAPGAPAFLSQAITTGGLTFVAGQVHADSDNTLVGNTTEEKVAQIMKNISAVLNAAGSSLEDIVKVVVYVTDMSVMPDLNKVYPSYFTEPYPVREAVCVAALPLGASIEISVIASK